MIYFILALSLILRLTSLNQSLWLDEAIQVQVVKNLSLSQLFTQYLPTDFNPPLMYLIHRYWGQLFGFSIVSMRLPSVLFGVLTVWVVYQIARSLKPKIPYIATTVGLLMATSPLHVYYSQEARAYSLAALLVSLSFYYLIQFIKYNSSKLAYLLTTTLLLYTHYLAWLILPAQLLSLYLIKPGKIKLFLKLQLVTILSIVPWLPTLYQQLNLGSNLVQNTPVWSEIVGGSSLKTLLLIPVKFLIGRVSIDSNQLFALALSWPFIFLGLVVISAIYNFDKQAKFLKVVFSWLLVPLSLAYCISLKLPILSYFRLLFLLPAFYLLIAIGINNFRLVKNLILGIFLIINLTALSFYLFNPKFHREDWHQLTNDLKSHYQGNEPIVLISVVNNPFLYHWEDQIDTVDYLDIDQVASSSSVWLVPYAEPIFYPHFSASKFLIDHGFTEEYHQTYNGNLELLQYLK